MFWRSVVGKLWFTILLLVSVVLTILTIMLLQYFEKYHTKQAKEQLMNQAYVISSILENYECEETALATSNKLLEDFSMRLLIIFEKDHYLYFPEDETVEKIPVEIFYTDRELSTVIKSRQSVMTQRDFPFYLNGNEIHNEVILVGMPVDFKQKRGVIYLYQYLEVVNEASVQTKNIIYLNAGIAIILTTIFAFFLSTRITAPLRKMRQASLEVAKGNFNTKVPILARDEIGLLGMAFNRMGTVLNANVTALNQEKEQLARILSSMADGVITLDRRGAIVATNPPADQFIRAWQFEQEQKINHDQLPKTIKNLFQLVVSDEKEQIAEVDIQGRTWVILMTPLYDESYVRGAVAVLRDMTEERLHDKLRKDFIANVSHELRTPISMLQGYSEAIIDDVATTDEEKKELARIIYDESLRMGRLVNEFLDLARMEAGHIQLHLSSIDISEFSHRVSRKFFTIAKEHNIELKEDISYIEQKIVVDPDRIEQVLTNLIDNAIRHTSEKGSVTLSVQPFKKGVLISVKDTGSGIPEEDIPFVFERFYKTDKARTRGRSGTGLGLAIVKNIVEAHNGYVTVKSKLRQGTTFSFFLPSKYEE